MKKGKRPRDEKQGEKISLDPLTFDEALAGLLATEPPAKPIKASKRRKADDASSPTPTRAPRRKRAPKSRPDTTH